jgi:hypothetical protein
MSARWSIGTKGCTTLARAAAQLSSVCSLRGGLLRDHGHGTCRRKHARSSTLEGNEAEGEDAEDYTPLSDAKKEQMYHDTDEIRTARNEAPIPTGTLRDLLNCCDITTPPEFRIKRVPRPG